MSKYIPADKLITEIERLKGLLIRGACAAQIEMETNCKDEAYNEVLSFITYLQQEQPSLPSNLDEAAQKVEDYYDVGEEHGYLYCHCGDIEDAFKAGAEWMAEQFQREQPEVDLEKEINSYCGTRDIRPVPDFMDAVARHFYELGKARREE